MSSTLTKASENARLQHVYQTIIEFAENTVADRTWIGRPRRAMQKWIYQVPDVPVLSPAVRTRILLERLGPTYVKLGQIVSSQANVLPDEWKTELDRLQNEVPPVPYEDIRQAIIEELGASPEELYAEFSQTPLAAASLGQVHVARLHDGRKVAVKIQRPRMQKQVRADLGITRFFGRYAERRSEWAREVGIASMLNEFSSTLLEELDYYAEAYNMTRLAATLDGIPGVHVPDLVRSLSTDKVLTQEFVSGVKISDVEAIRAAGHDPAVLGDAALRAAIKMLLIDGFFHADPHPGNLIVNLDTGVVTFLDCGMVGELTVAQRVHLVMLLWAYTRGDIPAMGDQLRSLSVPFRPVDEEGYRKSFERRMSRYASSGADVTVVLSQGMGVLRDNGLRLDPQLTLAIKSLTQASAFYKPLAPKDRPFATAALQAAQELGMEAFTEEAVVELARKEGLKLAGRALQEAPDYLKGLFSWRDQLKKGRLTVYVDTSSLDAQMSSLRSIVQTIVVAVLVGGAMIGSAIAAAAFTQLPGQENAARWTIWAFFAAMALAFVLAIVFLAGFVRDRRRAARERWGPDRF
ncbi:MAG: AarF/UbiB family protein [Candidatus Nanopelagicales bacterium]